MVSIRIENKENYVLQLGQRNFKTYIMFEIIYDYISFSKMQHRYEKPSPLCVHLQGNSTILSNSSLNRTNTTVPIVCNQKAIHITLDV